MVMLIQGVSFTGQSLTSHSCLILLINCFVINLKHFVLNKFKNKMFIFPI